EHFILAALIMTTVLHSLIATSRPHTQYVLITLQAVLSGAFAWCNTQLQHSPRLTAGQSDLLNKLPDDVREAIKSLGLEPDFVRYACC
ncbi:hypothetical protein L227DRAFT_467796, partial [Lentinus tigrinus ALCF2SS1-6]